MTILKGITGLATIAVLFPAIVVSFSIPAQRGLTISKKDPECSFPLRSTAANDGDNDDDEYYQPESDLDQLVSIAEINALSALIGGPVFDEDANLEETKDQLWAFVEGEAESDVDQMCMGQLSGWMANRGETFPEGTTLDQARDIVRNLEALPLA